MQIFGPFLNGYANPHLQIWEDLRKRTFAVLERHAEEKAAFRSPDEVAKRGTYIRDTFLESIGGLPPRDTPLNPTSTGIIEQDRYRIEKIIFESQPQAYVTSLLYVPRDLKKPAPAVLFVSGHHLDAKHEPEYQRVCHDLAINGFVVLATDPVGQGERIAHRNPDTRDMPWEWGVVEHSQHGQQCILTGTSVSRYFLHDMVRGLDYLEIRPEVDAEHLGVTGNSGGGTQTTLLCMSGDPRIRAAMPCTYVTAREHIFMDGIAQDAEQIQFGMTGNGINYDDFFLPIAPAPVLIGSVSDDYFAPEGSALTAKRLKDLYRLLGAEDDVDWVLAPGEHMYCKELREAAVHWFCRHLMGEERAFESLPDEALPLLPPEELWCTPQGHVYSALPDRKTPYHLNAELPIERPRPESPEALRRRIVEVLRIGERLDHPTEMYARTQQTQEEDGIEARSVFFRSEDGMHVAGALVRRLDHSPTEAVLFLAPDGTVRFDDHLETVRPVLDAGKSILIFDPRGTGSVYSHRISPRNGDWPGTYFHTDSWMSYLAYCLGDCLLGMRVFDVIRAVHYLRDVQGFDRLGIWAQGLAPSLWGYLAAALEPAVAHTRVDDLLESFEAIERTDFYRKDFTPSLVAHGVLQAFDLPELRMLFDGRGLEATTVDAAEPGGYQPKP